MNELIGEKLWSWLSPQQYMPHGSCYLWQTPLVGIHALADTTIAIAYFSIALLLYYFVRKRQDTPFKGVFLMFAAFIISCGLTHLAAVWTLWYPAYWLAGGLKLFTAIVSGYTAIELVPLLPKAIAVPSPTQLEALNRELEQQIAERTAAEREIRLLNLELENRVTERTAALAAVNEQLRQQISERQQIELELRTSQRFSQRIAELTPNVLYIHDLERQCNIYTNRFANEILGYGKEELQHLTTSAVEILVHPEDRERVVYHLQHCLSLADENFLELEYRIKDSHGQWHWLYSRDTVFARTPTGKPKQILGIATDITKRKEAEIQLQQVNEQLAQQVSQLAQRNREMELLGEVTDFLQACQTLQEAREAIADLLMPLFPDCAGGVFLIDNSRHLVEAVATWGNLEDSNLLFAPNECWALRRGSLHSASSQTRGLCCQHVQCNCHSSTLCVPMMAHGETLGLLYLSFAQAKISPAQKQLAKSAGEQIASALANLQLKESLQQQSIRDPLTGLFNRRYLEVSLERELLRAQRNGGSLGVIMLDIDRFKCFNDTYGHEAGDAVLREVAAYLVTQIRATDFACRYGGEELILLMPEASLQDTARRAEQLRQGISRLEVNHRGQLLAKITASFGVSGYPAREATDAEMLIRAADLALYRAKASGRDRVVVATENGHLLPTAHLPACPRLSLLEGEENRQEWTAIEQ